MLKGASSCEKSIRKVLPFSKLSLHFTGHGTKQFGTEEYFLQASFLSPGKYYEVKLRGCQGFYELITSRETVFTSFGTFSEAFRKVRVLLTIVISFTWTRINSLKNIEYMF